MDRNCPEAPVIRLARKNLKNNCLKYAKREKEKQGTERNYVNCVSKNESINEEI